MKWFEDLILQISPEAAYRREAWRKGLGLLRNYDAAKTDRLNAWHARNDSAEFTDAPSRDTIRARARDLERNSDVALGILAAFERNIIGAGLQLQAKTEDEGVNTSIEDLWKEWSKARNCDVTGQQNLSDILRMAERRKRVDGGVLILKRYTDQGILPFQLQMIEVDELDNIVVTPKVRTNKVRGGIEYNEWNKPVGYYIRQYGIDGFSMMPPVYVEAKDVIFYWTKRRPSQIREISDMSATVTRVRDMNQFMEAVGVKERIAACFALMIRKQVPTGGSLGRSSSPVTADNGNAGYPPKKITPGMIAELQPGDAVDTISPPNSGTSAADFLRTQQRLAAAGQGLSYETVSRDMSQVNYSSARQGLIEDERTYAIERGNLIESVLDEIYETFVISLVLAGKLEIPKFWNNKRAWFNHVWVAPARRWIDPQKEANANQIALKTGQRTIQQIAAENGYDWREQIDEMAAAVAYARTQGIDLGGVLYGNPEYAQAGATIYPD